MMSVNDKNDYHRIIREMIKNEDEVRNSRNNWFITIQGLLVNAVINSLVHQKDLMLSINATYVILISIVSLGFITSVSFLHAAWRSERSIKMALACWDLFLIENTQKIQDFPPISLITKGIIDRGAKDNIIGAMDWEKKVSKMMYKDDDCLKCCDKRRNKLDFLMPFQCMPIIFVILWFVSIIGIIFLWTQN